MDKSGISERTVASLPLDEYQDLLKAREDLLQLVRQIKALSAMHGSGLCVWGRCVCGLDKLKASVEGHEWVG